jgi:hypothetical protein
MNVPDLISMLMFVLVGGLLANAGVTVMDKPFHFFSIMICMVVIKTIGLTH